jgi:hypothetical protein
MPHAIIISLGQKWQRTQHLGKNNEVGLLDLWCCSHYVPIKFSMGSPYLFIKFPMCSPNMFLIAPLTSSHTLSFILVAYIKQSSQEMKITTHLIWDYPKNDIFYLFIFNFDGPIKEFNFF